MDLFSKTTQPEAATTFVYPAAEEPEPVQMSIQDSITSLMNMADKMEALLPPEINFDFPTEQLSDEEPSSSGQTLSGTLPEAILPAIKSESTAHSIDHSSVTIGPTVELPTQHNELPTAIPALATVPTSTPQAAIITGLDPNASSLTTSVTISGTGPAPPPVPPVISAATTVAPMCVPAMPVSTQVPIPTPTLSDISAPYPAIPSFVRPCASSGIACASSGAENTQASGDGTSPVAIRDLPQDTSRITKPRKTPRKPKTYSKPVASRFCHICSRMPRRGQGSATCRRMAEGFCRKIVCEQCLREQGWDYEAIMADPSSWLCPHCADVCPPRSQCHIYNRINARRKRTGSAQKQVPAVPPPISTPEMVLGQYGHLLNESQVGLTQILQPPPNFRLNLPPQYTQL